MNLERQLQDKIKQLEKENSDLKKKIVKMENTVLIALDLLTRKRAHKYAFATDSLNKP